MTRKSELTLFFLQRGRRENKDDDNDVENGKC